MNRISKVMLLCLSPGVFMFSSPVFAGEMSNDDLMRETRSMKARTAEMKKALKEKREEISEIKREKGISSSKEISANWSDKVTLSGAVELDYSYADDMDTGDNTMNDSTSDLVIGTAELGAEIAFHEYVTGNLILKGENLDGDDHVFWDKASIAIQKDGFPLYFVGGKRGLPFGIFESHLINDPLTQDLYEIADMGMTLGFTPGILGLDISGTVYRGEALMTHMLEGAYGLDRTYLDSTAALPGWRTGGMSGSYAETDDVSSYIGNITLGPVKGISVAAFYNFEPGDKKRNNTLGGMFHCEISKLTLDLEYITALQREKDSIDNLEHKESAFSGTVAFQLMDPLEAAFRYEAFDDDINCEQNGHLDNRYSLGLTYNLFEKESFATSLMVECRKSSYEKAAGSAADDSLTEFFSRLTIEF